VTTTSPPTAFSAFSSKGPGYAALVTGGTVTLYVYKADYSMDFTVSGTASVSPVFGTSENTADGSFGVPAGTKTVTFTGGKGTTSW